PASRRSKGCGRFRGRFRRSRRIIRAPFAFGASMSGNIDSVLNETRVFPSPAEFAARAAIGSLEAYRALHRRSVEEPEAFWAEQAESLAWFRRWDRVLNWDNRPFAKWFEG